MNIKDMLLHYIFILLFPQCEAFKSVKLHHCVLIAVGFEQLRNV